MYKYSNLEKILNKQFLGNTEISQFLFNRNIYNKKQINIKKIFITGLARSGSTALLNQIFQHKQIASIQYKHMPFVLSPYLSNFVDKFIFSNNKEIEKERIHGDNIFISQSSPECLDEPFWIKEDINYFKKPLTFKKSLKSISLLGYKNFLNKHCFYQGKKVIVIKNNNNHIRLIQLSEYFKNSLFLVLFRHPIYQASSLLNTHKRITKLQKKDGYILEYMNLIGHREFGFNQTYFKYDETSLNALQINAPKGNLTFEYWLQSWINCYGWLLKNYPYNKNILLISYENLCKDNNIIKAILDSFDIEFNFDKNLINKNQNYPKIYNGNLVKKALEIYNNLTKISY